MHQTAPRRVLLFASILLLAAPAIAQTRAEEGLKAVQRQVEALEPALVKSTVALRLGGVSGSGVIISPDGYVLTAAHVIRGSRSRRCSVILSDGKRLPATVLGSDEDGDCGIVKIDGASDLPAATLGDSSTLRPGQWVLATGHPLGPRTGRPPVLRIGRVQGRPGTRRFRPMRHIITDTPIISGDSGGPLFDLNGRVVGIHSMITEGQRRMTSIHVPVNLAKAELAQMERGDDPGAPDGKSKEYATALRGAEDALDAGEVQAALRSAQQSADLDPTSADARLLLARAYARAGDRTRAAAALVEACDRGYSDVDAIRRDSRLSSVLADPAVQKTLDRVESLSSVPGAGTRDEAVLSAVGRIEGNLNQGVVRVRAGDSDIALGTVMSAGGDVLTKASELPEGSLTCVLPDGRTVRAERVAVDTTYDLALLRVKGQRLAPIVFADKTVAGSWAVSPAAGGTVAAVGVVGVADMPVNGRGISPKATSKAYMGVRLEPIEPAALHDQGLAHGIGVTVEQDMPADKAGIRSGDIITEVDGRAISDPDAFMDYMVGKKPGDSVAVRLARGAERLGVTVNLTTRPTDLPGRGGLPEMLSGEVSHMQGPFPHVLHHDSVLPPSAMGGPVLDTEGRCIGVNIARADRSSTYAIPAAVVRDVYQRLAGQGGAH